MSFKSLSAAIDMLENTLVKSDEIVEYRLTGADLEQASKDVKTLRPGQLKALAGLMRFYYDSSTRKVEAAWVEKQVGNARDMKDLVDRKFVFVEMNPRNRRQADVYWLAPKGLVVAQAIRDGKVKTESVNGIAEARLGSSDLKRFFGGRAKKLKINDRKGNSISIKQLPTLRDIDLIVQGIDADGDNAGIVRVHIDANGRLSTGFKTGQSMG